MLKKIKKISLGTYKFLEELLKQWKQNSDGEFMDSLEQKEM